MPIKWTARGKRIAKGAAIGVAGFAGGYGVARHRGKKRERNVFAAASRMGYELGQGRTVRLRDARTGKTVVVTPGRLQAQRARRQKKPKTTAVGRKRQKR